MKKIMRRAASVIIAAATVFSVGALSLAGTTGSALPGLVISADAATGVGYINAAGESKMCSSYTAIKSGTSTLNGGWYVVNGNVTISGRLNVTKDSYVILTDGSKLTVKGGIGVSSGVKFNVYTQDNATGALYAGTTNGSNTTASSGLCGIGGSGAKVNIVGGNVYSRGSNGAYGIYGSQIRLYWTNPTDSIYASSFSSAPSFYSAFADTENGTAYSANTAVSVSNLNNVMLKAAYTIDKYTTDLEEGVYAAFGSVTVADRINLNGDVDLVLGKNATLRADEGITVPTGDTLTISGAYGKLYAGTTNGSNFSANDNDAGIGSGSGTKTGNIVIKSGTIYANGGRNAAGIGGNGSYVEIDGGTVNATGGQYAAGIGSGRGDNGSQVTITGGKVNANGGANAAGIGSGYSSANSRISLGLSNANDSIYASSYSGSVSFSRNLYVKNTSNLAQANNINGNTLVSEAARVYKYTVTYVTNGGSYVSSVTVDAGTFLNVLPTPTRDGYLFDGWYLDSNFKTYFNPKTMAVTSDITLYAKWTNVGSFTITFDTKGGDYEYPMYVSYGDSIPQNALPFPTRSGYTFNGWYFDKNCTDAYYQIPIKSNLTLYAGWTKVTTSWTISFDTNGGSYEKPIYIKDGDQISQTDLPFPTRSGYTFNGWYFDKACTDAYFKLPIYSDLTLYAGWTKISTTWTISFDTNGGDYEYPMYVSDGDQISQTDLPFPTRDGYKFNGWYFDRGCTDAYFKHPITSDLTLYAGWTQQISYYTVNFYLDGSFIDSQTVQEGGYAYDPYRGQYDWTTASGRAFDFSTPITMDYDLYASTPVITYCTVYFDTKGGSYVDSQTVMYGGYVSYPNDPYLSGCVFTGWYTDRACSVPFNFGTPITSDITLYANWEYDAQYGSTFGGAGLIAAIVGGVVLVGGGTAAAIVISKKKKNK